MRALLDVLCERITHVLGLDDPWDFCGEVALIALVAISVIVILLYVGSR